MTHFYKRLLASALAGMLLGIVSDEGILRGTWLNLLIWGAAGLALGWWFEDAGEANRAGAVYGLCLGLAFMISAFKGHASQLPGFIALTAAVSAAGALCGLIAFRLGRRARLAAKS